MISNTPGLCKQMQIYADICSNCVFRCRYLFNLAKSEDICRLLQVYAGQRRHMQILALVAALPPPEWQSRMVWLMESSPETSTTYP